MSISAPRLVIVLIIVSMLLLTVGRNPSATAQTEPQCDAQVYYGIQHCVGNKDQANEIHLILVDLSDPHVRVQTVLPLRPGAAPNGLDSECNSVNPKNHPEPESSDPTSNCPYEYPYETLRSMLERYQPAGQEGEKAVAIINTDYFGCTPKCGEPKGEWGAQGLAVRNGVRLDGKAHNDDDAGKFLGSTHPSLAISRLKIPKIGIPGSEQGINRNGKDTDSKTKDTYYNTVAGAPIIIQAGQLAKTDEVDNTNCPGPYPGEASCTSSAQSAAGVTSDRRLILATARMNASGIANYLKNTAFKFDGGGSAGVRVQTALKFDGGGSAHIGWLNGKGEFDDFDPGGEDRPVAEALLIFSEKKWVWDPPQLIDLRDCDTNVFLWFGEHYYQTGHFIDTPSPTVEKSSPILPPIVGPVCGAAPLSKDRIPAGGTWISPDNAQTLTNSVHFAAHASDNPTGSGIAYLNFIAWWPSLGPKDAKWEIVCPRIFLPTHDDVYECDWDFSGAPAGDIHVSFEVFDKAGNHIRSPNGERIIHHTVGATIVVNSKADIIADDGACTLREAIINANNNDQSGSTDCPAGTGDDTISLKGFYQLAIEGMYESAARTGDLDITDNLTVQGLDTGATIDGNSLDRVFDISNGAVVTFSRITIQNGSPYMEDPQGPGEHGGGGGIAISGSTVVVQESTVTGNFASGSGAGIANAGGSLQIENSTISNNRVGDGNGGGIANIDGFVRLQNSTIANNTTEFDGGGISNLGGGTVEVVNTTISGNTFFDGSGGGIFNDAGTIILNSSTITGNGCCSGQNYGEGGGIENVAGTVRIQNSIIAGNLAATNPDCSGQMSSLGNNLIGNSAGCDVSQDGTNQSDLVGTQNELLNPLLGPLQDNDGVTFTHALLPGSPAIDAGSTESCPATDQRGVARPQGAACDIGAFEVSPPFKD
jgi:CSLREA domain-containing protein